MTHHKNKNLQSIKNNTQYSCCTFYLEKEIFHLKNSHFENCSFRSLVIFSNLQNCQFRNCSFSVGCHFSLSKRRITSLSKIIFSLRSLLHYNSVQEISLDIRANNLNKDEIQNLKQTLPNSTIYHSLTESSFLGKYSYQKVNAYGEMTTYNYTFYTVQENNVTYYRYLYEDIWEPNGYDCSDKLEFGYFKCVGDGVLELFPEIKRRRTQLDSGDSEDSSATTRSSYRIRFSCPKNVFLPCSFANELLYLSDDISIKEKSFCHHIATWEKDEDEDEYDDEYDDDDDQRAEFESIPSTCIAHFTDIASHIERHRASYVKK